MTRAVESLVLVESDTQHPLLQLLGLEVTTAANTQPAAPVSTREEWAQEARKLELQGKEEQAQAIRDAFLQHKPVPWVPWSEAVIGELLPRALDRQAPSNKPRQTLLDYALWHGQVAWIELLAAQTTFAPAHTVTVEGQFGGPEPNRWESMAVRERAWRTTAALRLRHLHPWAARNFKDLLRQCDQFGVDHRTPTGATPLMMAARAGNLPLIEALLERGADPLVEDDFGHTAWLFALNRATEDADFARHCIPALFERIAPAALDVQVDGRLLRLERHQAEYWLLSLMLAGFKTLLSSAVQRPFDIAKYRKGFFADTFLETLQHLPDYLWSPQRRKRTYLNHVLARAECHSSYQPARRLWARVSNGYYLPNPTLLLRVPHAHGDAPAWRPVLEVLNLPWAHAGTVFGDGPWAGLVYLESIAKLRAEPKDGQVAEDQPPDGAEPAEAAT